MMRDVMRRWAVLCLGSLAMSVPAGCARARHATVEAQEAPAAPEVALPASAPSDLYITEPPTGVIRARWWRWMQGRILYPLQENLDVARVARTLTGRQRPAIDMVEGYVADSSFFTNRDIAALTPDEVRWGPVQPSTAPQPPLTFEGLRSPGRAPGLFVADAKGEHYLLLLDAPDHSELNTGAEVVTSKLLHALGYNVLPAEIYQLAPADVQMDSPRGLDLPDHEPGTLDDVERLLAPRVDAQGRVRTAAIRWPEASTVVGSFSFKQYQHYAALRALRLAQGWLNNVAAGELQTLMTWDGRIARGHLVDFGSALARLDGRFDPQRWMPETPNIAFDRMTRDDAVWMARRISALSEVHLAAAVAAGQYQPSEEAVALIEMLRRRQAVIRQRYLEAASERPAP